MTKPHPRSSAPIPQKPALGSWRLHWPRPLLPPLVPPWMSASRGLCFRCLPWPKISVPTICAKGQDELEGRAEEGDARCHHTVAARREIAIGFVAGLVGSCKLSLLPNELGGFKDVGPKKTAARPLQPPTKGNFVT
jgi:hypothetical protein